MAFQHARFTRKSMLPCPAVSSYFTFSTLPFVAFARKIPAFVTNTSCFNRIQAVIFCGTFCCFVFTKHPALHRCIALCCPDFPPHYKEWSDSLIYSSAKIGQVFEVNSIHPSKTITISIGNKFQLRHIRTRDETDLQMILLLFLIGVSHEFHLSVSPHPLHVLR